MYLRLVFLSLFVTYCYKVEDYVPETCFFFVFFCYLLLINFCDIFIPSLLRGCVSWSVGNSDMYENCNTNVYGN